tara:strand:+ start:1190 stop:1309 length:120 start_codon:yes stop_codon:yes gene_type:complete
VNKLKSIAKEAYQIWSEAETKYKMIAVAIAVFVILSIII